MEGFKWMRQRATDGQFMRNFSPPMEILKRIGYPIFMTAEKNKKLILTRELLREIEIFSKHFLTIDEIAYNLGVKPKYFQRFCEKHREVVEVISSARSKTKAFVVGKLMEKVNAGNVPAMIFVLKTQFGFHESVNVGLTESTRDKLIPKKLGTDPIEATRIYQEVMK